MVDYPRTLSICTGIGGLDLGIHRALGGRTVCMVEREAACVEILATRMEEGSLDPAPIWSDAKTFDGKAWRGAVDIVAAGYPCQPFSVAGKRRGSDDPRHLWPDIKRVIAEAQPGAVVLENVQGHVRLGLSEVLEDLSELGFNAEWGVYSAAQAGAPHRRNRLFILAYTDGQRLQGWSRSESESTHEGSSWPSGPEGDWSDVPEYLWPATEPDLCGVPDGLSNRVDRLRALGNAVVPQQAQLALTHLLSRVSNNNT